MHASCFKVAQLEGVAHSNGSYSVYSLTHQVSKSKHSIKGTACMKMLICLYRQELKEFRRLGLRTMDEAEAYEGEAKKRRGGWRAEPRLGSTASGGFRLQARCSMEPARTADQA